MDFETCETCGENRTDRERCQVEIGQFKRVRYWCTDCQYAFVQVFSKFDKGGHCDPVDDEHDK